MSHPFKDYDDKINRRWSTIQTAQVREFAVGMEFEYGERGFVLGERGA